MFNKDFSFMEKRLVFKNPTGPSSQPIEGGDKNIPERISTLRSSVELDLANEHPFEFLKANPKVNGEATPSQILALRKIFMELTFSGERHVGPIPIDILESEPDFDDTSTDRTEVYANSEKLGWLDTCILQFRIAEGQTLNENALVIDSKLITDIIQFVTHDPTSFKSETELEAYRAAEDLAQEEFEEAERKRYENMTPQQAAAERVREEEEMELADFELDIEMRQKEEARRAAFVAWRIRNPLFNRSGSQKETLDPAARLQIETEFAQQYPFEFLEANSDVNGVASPAQILALRNVFHVLTFDGEGPLGSLIIDIVDRNTRAIDDDTSSTNRLESTTQAQDIGWLDLCILQFRIKKGQTLDANSLVIDSQLISDVVQFVKEDPTAFKPAKAVEAARDAEDAEQAEFEEAENARLDSYENMTPQQVSEAKAKHDAEVERLGQEADLEMTQEEEARRALFTAWRVRNPIPKR